jgi:hypothetical protein
LVQPSQYVAGGEPNVNLDDARWKKLYHVELLAMCVNSIIGVAAAKKYVLRKLDLPQRNESQKTGNRNWNSNFLRFFALGSKNAVLQLYPIIGFN